MTETGLIEKVAKLETEDKNNKEDIGIAFKEIYYNSELIEALIVRLSALEERMKTIDGKE